MSKKSADTNINPHGLCTWDDQSDCDNCGDKGLLFCKLDKKMANAFLTLFAPYILMAFFGLVMVGILTSAWWYLILYGAFTMVLFPCIEFGVLCRHCPFYGRSGKTVQCIAGSGVPKTYKYNPKPMSKWEHLVMYGYYTFMIGFPIFSGAYCIYFVGRDYQAYGKIALLGMIGIEIAIVLTAIAFNYCLAIYVCRKCINFSCPWNKVEKPVVDEYLRQNPEMRDAWEKTGYRLG